ncbi:MAG: TOBE domain-containing protein, partial [Chloroflexi bacterium]|nr:TOBE domain-containing protein [Chloroflexota bacterium]
DQSEALALSDRILLMRSGEIVEDGCPTDVYERPTTVYGARFVGAANCLAASVVEIGPAGATVRLGTGDILHARADALSTAEVGASVSIVIRPEDVAIAETRDGLTNVAAGILRRSTYLGSHKELLVGVGDQLVRVRAAKNLPIADGGSVTLHLPADALRLLVEK